jgi:hypothetical protein
MRRDSSRMFQPSTRAPYANRFLKVHTSATQIVCEFALPDRFSDSSNFASAKNHMPVRERPQSNRTKNTPWKSVSSRLRTLQDRMRTHEERFRVAGYVATADDLQRAILILADAEQTATLAAKGGPPAKDLEAVKMKRRSKPRVNKPSR